ncbi:hypothetical protein [Enteroscipio rubneri]|uniref:hypothetical protein n=1 Tax=Enteroscipio rubneri TaxID=2070686 RepID=UPI00320A4E90
MGRRTLNAHKLQLNKRMEPDNLVSPADVSGKTLVDIVEQWIESIKGDGAIEVGADTYVSVKNCYRFNDNILVADVMSGKTGESGIIHDIEGVSDDIPIGEKQAPMSSCRALLFSPSNGHMAMWFSEYSARSSGARNLLTLLKKKWPQLNTGATLKESRVIATEMLLDNGKITEVEVRLTRRAADLADGVESREGVFSHVFRPTRKNPLSARLLDVFRKNPSKAFDYVELSESDHEDHEVFVSIDVDGHKRKISVMDPEDGVYYREELNGPGQAPLTDAELVEHCSKEAVSYFERSGLCWEPEWSVPSE